MEKSRRQAVIDIAAALGVMLVSVSFVGRRQRGMSGVARGIRFRRGTAGSGPAPRVRPAPFAVKRHG